MITIVDYQMGNLRSVQKAFEHVGATAEISGDPDRVGSAEKLVLPGVGSFGDAVRELQSRHLVEPLRAHLQAGRPFLGICLGLQLLFEQSAEDATVPGLGFFAGSVERFDLPPPWKVPHMGWNSVQMAGNVPIWAGIPNHAYCYFVHSYYVVPSDPTLVAMWTDYHLTFCSMIQYDRIVATQFHPEKSQSVGLRMIANFADRI